MIHAQFRLLDGGAGKRLGERTLCAVPDRWEEIEIMGRRYKIAERRWSLPEATALEGAPPLCVVLMLAEVG
jgi:hypothetical protein